ncbi:MAG: sigma-E processing peptidase SpoIIGA [Eubacterium sp.]|nr:sigma-E processing peptidase SpoIIGA [Eubacterium sp.]
MTLYVDVLFVVNFFITYLLLLLTKLFVKENTKTARLLISSFAGGSYSLVILIDELHFLITALGKIIVSAVIILIAFGFKRATVFIKTLCIFYFSNMLLLGVILALWLLFKPQGIAIHNDVLYFDIPARALLISALFAYLIALLVVKLYNRTVGKNEIYSLTIFKNGEELHMFAFADTGNKLKEPFSDYPVIVVDGSKISFDAERVIPFNSVGGEGVLKAFKPDKIIISSGKKSFETDKVYVAVSSVESKDFSAILNPEIINI